jgi:hypothetical protein
MRLHQEVLDEDRKIIFNQLSKFSRIGYLAGGTALALQLSHRISYDFDVFCAGKINKSLILKVREFFSVSSIIVNSEEELTFLTKEGVKVSFIYYPFNLDKYLEKAGKGMKLLSVAGIALAKAYTLNRRGSFRDYVDLYFILKEKRGGIEKIIEEAKKVYGEFFSEKLFLTQLVYTEDIPKKEKTEIKFLKNKVSSRVIEEHLKKEADKYSRKILA